MFDNDMIDLFMMMAMLRTGNDYRDDKEKIEGQFDKLKELLDKAEIPYETTYLSLPRNYQIAYPSHTDRVCSVVQGPSSYGGAEGYLEIMGLLTESEKEDDEVIGWLTADEVFERIQAHWEGQTK